MSKTDFIIFDKNNFKHNETHDWKYNACLNFADDDLHLITEGYREIADLAVQHIEKTGRNIDTLIYPIIYNYRHTIELQLKRIIRDASLLVSPSQYFRPIHDLTKLWSQAKLLLKKICKDSSSDNYLLIEELINNLTEYDRGATTFRYLEDHQGNRLIPKEKKYINIKTMSDTFSSTIDFLEGVLTNISEQIKIEDQITCEEIQAWKDERYDN